MKTYDSSHWVTDTAVSGKTSIEVIQAIGSDLEEAKRVLEELTAHYLVTGTTSESIKDVQEILDDVFDTPLTKGHSERASYIKAQVQSAYVVALTANDLQRFMSEAVKVMLSNIEEFGFADSESSDG